jgi:HEAT repeat protein
MRRSRKMKLSKLAAGLLFAVLAGPLLAEEPGPVKLTDALIRIALDKDTDVRYLARTIAPHAGAGAVAPLCDLLTHERREVALTARASLEALVHHAGRPGSGDERAAVAEELVKLLRSERPAGVRREVLHLVAFIGGEPAVPAVAAFLDDPDPRIAEQARLSLERIPGPAAVAALLEGARRAPPARAAEVIYSLSKKGDRSVVKDLVGFSASSEPAVKLAALEGLARLGAPEAAPRFEEEIGRAADFDKERLFDEYLRLADNLRAQGGEGASSARQIYERVLAAASLDHQRERALGASCPPGDAGRLPALVAALGDRSARVRVVAASRIAELKGPEVLAALVAAFDGARGAARPHLLRAIADRDASAAKPVLERAASEGEPELRIAALDLLGRLDDPAMEASYLRAAESGPDWLKSTALKGYLLLAKRKAGAGKPADALPMYGRALDLSADPGQRLEALQGIIAAAEPREIDRVRGLLQDPQLGPEAQKGYLSLATALGKRGDRAGAEKNLTAIYTGDYPRDLRVSAGDALRSLGIDPQAKAHADGFLVDWWVVTPLPDTDGKGLERKDFPEEEIELDKEHRIGERRFRWQKVQDLAVDGKLSLLPVFRRSEKLVTYAYAEVDSPAAREVLFKMGSDDGIACWLNGERVHLKNVSRPLKADDDSVPARLARGKNKVLLKISQKDGEWGFAFRITDRDGKPIDLSPKPERSS